jgi:hypothetical protein
MDSPSARSLLIKSMMIVLGLCALGGAQADAKLNDLVIVVANGPYAGTYKPNGTAVICMHAKKQKVFTAAFKDFEAHGGKDLAEAGVEVMNPDSAGEKHGNIRIAFGDPDKKPTVYEVSFAPVVLEITAQGGMITFDGKTASGIGMKVTARCLAVDNL